ncbi:hypothetical protein [Streptomyces sp. NPDC051993]|uniref:hypothetical protein n=1 Tax=Streptomyces sp. NPDC051993 TaxID=3155286 RepID=UPI003424B2BE
MSRHRFQGDWNYARHPVSHMATGQRYAALPAPPPDGPEPSLLKAPVLTGMTVQELEALVRELAPAHEASQRCPKPLVRRLGRSGDVPAG